MCCIFNSVLCVTCCGKRKCSGYVIKVEFARRSTERGVSLGNSSVATRRRRPLQIREQAAAGTLKPILERRRVLGHAAKRVVKDVISFGLTSLAINSTFSAAQNRSWRQLSALFFSRVFLNSLEFWWCSRKCAWLTYLLFRACSNLILFWQKSHTEDKIKC